jgi:hypothetical protein
MRFMIIVRSSQRSESGELPQEPSLTEMVAYHEELARAGVLVDASGLRPSSQGWRISYSGEQRSFVDGPFPETKELIAGYTIIQVQSREEAVAWTRRWPMPGCTGDSATIEVRQMIELDDFAPSQAVDRFRALGVGAAKESAPAETAHALIRRLGS